ncbi:DEAD/DEAH box helicase [Leptospira semungkisensis]|uniref:DEAD/DEAH box helicase n=1 Tax=Leptospira semungkisensis TaxID=2484985 RepID=A0A4R9FXQ5_9LEPT|nr:DEAD/DEAH box helicase [Leptospira semungkisensis]TGK03782.1 DEAD/DEAH box helicase [Leptospira semungkisensis]
MKLKEEELSKLLAKVLTFEHVQVARRLNYIEGVQESFPEDLLKEALIALDVITRNPSDNERKIAITICAVIWQYKSDDWNGLKDHFLLILTRIGQAPATMMIDEGYEERSQTFSPMDSYISQVAVALKQSSFEVRIDDSTFLLTQFQKNIWNKLDESKLLGISAPTSAGKSFILALKAISLLKERDGSIIYVVPTLSLVSQVSLDFRKLLNQFNMKDYRIQNTYLGDSESDKLIYVFTQEKAIGAFSRDSNPFKNVRMLIVDEIQNVERIESEDDSRSKILYDLLQEFRNTSSLDHIVISGPRIDNIDLVGSNLFGRKSAKENTRNSPVANFTYAIKTHRKKYYLNMYSELLGNPLSLPILKNKEVIGNSGGSKYTEAIYNYIFHTISGLGKNSINIIFSPTTKQARKTALDLSHRFEESNGNNEKISELIDYISETVHPEYDLCKVLKNKVAYHHAKLPSHVRNVLEKAISMKLINNIVCTTTLMQGVNLPAQNIIIRNPNLFVMRNREVNPQLTPYEIANLRGRAGRLLKDFIGRTFVLDENAFSVSEEAEDQQLFEDAYKEINLGYGDAYQGNKGLIDDQLSQEYDDQSIAEDNHFLVTYIRQSILKYGNIKAQNKLKSVGISINERLIKKISSELRKLEVSEETCFMNRYWDPFDLDRLYKTRNDYTIPISRFETNISGKLKNILVKLKSDFEPYFRRYLKLREVPGKDIIYSFCINAENWLKETKLQQILASDYHSDSELIENTIGTLQKDVTYGLPMLLKPLYDILAPEEPFLRFIETGAYNPVTRKLIEYNIARETAISLTEYFSNPVKRLETPTFEEIRAEVNRVYKRLDYWTKIQLEILL